MLNKAFDKNNNLDGLIFHSDQGWQYQHQSYQQRLKNNTISIGNNNHILKKASKILLNPEEASLEEISSLLNHYNGSAVLIDGIAVYPFNDPISAAKLNARYRELTSQNELNPKSWTVYK